MSISFQRGISGADVEMVPQAETLQSFYRGVQNHTEMKSLLRKYMANGIKVIKALVYLLKLLSLYEHLKTIL